MHLYKIADVVYANYTWRDKAGNTDGGYRPVIIRTLLPGTRYRVVKISRSNKVDHLLRIKVNSKEWKEMGLYDFSCDSFIDRNAFLDIDEIDIDYKLGVCPINLFARI